MILYPLDMENISLDLLRIDPIRSRQAVTGIGYLMPIFQMSEGLDVLGLRQGMILFFHLAQDALLVVPHNIHDC